MTSVQRPVVRRFQARFAAEAAAWAKRGGHAVYWEAPKRAVLVLPLPVRGEAHDLAEWAILDLGKKLWKEPHDGPFQGLATALVPPKGHWVVERRAERDSIHEGPRRAIELDCLACGACCKDNRVILEPIDVERLRDAGREDLLRRPYAKREDGRVVLTLDKHKRCHHLGQDNACAIYSIRPEACRVFPMASECCLSARETELGVYDGLAPDEDDDPAYDDSDGDAAFAREEVRRLFL